MATPIRHHPHVVVLGGGFAGLNVAKSLRGAPVRVTVIDRENHHLFQPLLYQVATAGLSTQHIASPIRRILRSQSNASVLCAEATGFELESNRMLLDEGSIEFDYLVVAPGVTHGYFGNERWSRFAPGLKTLADATRIRGKIIHAFERAERESNAGARATWSTFVVVGAGPTGVELAGAIAELSRHTLPGDFRSFDPREARIVLIEAADRVLPTYPESLSHEAERQLQRLGVQVRTNTRVSDISDGIVTLGEERIESRTVIWAAGISSPAILRQLRAPSDRAGRILVHPDLSLPGHPNVFVIGDAASLEQDGKPVPGVAPAAAQMGRWTAKNIERLVRGESTLPFRYRDKGSLATIGRAAAVADFGRLRFSGVVAWLLWLFVHIFFLIGFRSRLVVLFEWAWSWLTYQRVARAVTRRES